MYEAGFCDEEAGTYYARKDFDFRQKQGVE